MKNFLFTVIFLALGTGVVYAAEAASDTISKPRPKNLDSLQYGIASYYHSKFQGRPTASGELYDENLMTGAHNSLPFHTWVRVTYLKTGKSVVIKINDRLHYKNTRLVDLSKSAATKLGILKVGLARVKLEVLPGPPD
jgi:rare lipoprotein A